MKLLIIEDDGQSRIAVDSNNSPWGFGAHGDLWVPLAWFAVQTDSDGKRSISYKAGAFYTAPLYVMTAGEGPLGPTD